MARAERDALVINPSDGLASMSRAKSASEYVEMKIILGSSCDESVPGQTA
jgi:hypothetical protein